MRRAVLAACLIATEPAVAQSLSPADRARIVEAVDGIDVAVDAKDWARARAYFTDTIDADFTSLAGGTPARIPADQLIAGWRRNLHADKASHHMRTNHQVTVRGDTAEVLSKGYAFNKLASRLGGDLWEVWGDYRHMLVRTPDGWRVSGMRFTVTHARGNERARDFVPEGR